MYTGVDSLAAGGGAPGFAVCRRLHCLNDAAGYAPLARGIPADPSICTRVRCEVEGASEALANGKVRDAE